MRLIADQAIGENDQGIDTLLVAGGPYIDSGRRNRALINWIKSMSTRVRRIGSVCTGAFLLAESGILEGRRATTHWGYCQQLAEEFPNINVEADKIYLQDGATYTSGGVTAGIDLALYLVGEDLGHESAANTARSMVTFPSRMGGQTQYRRFFLGENQVNDDFHKLQEWISANPQEDLSVTALARRVSMSPRNFIRLFRQEVGITPAKYVEHSRLLRAFFLLEQTLMPLEAIARQSGFGSSEIMRRSFQRQLKLSPQEYRTRFRSPDYKSPVVDQSYLWDEPSVDE
jgi:transcriptional regulator GlxA family with amidase domain